MTLQDRLETSERIVYGFATFFGDVGGLFSIMYIIGQALSTILIGDNAQPSIWLSNYFRVRQTSTNSRETALPQKYDSESKKCDCVLNTAIWSMFKRCLVNSKQMRSSKRLFERVHQESFKALDLRTLIQS